MTSSETKQIEPIKTTEQNNEAREGQWFGFTKIDPEIKKTKVKSVFDSVSENYDIMNDVMSFGIHRLWKNHFTSLIPIQKDEKLLDMASGTCDILKRLYHKCPDARYIASDINEAMLNEGRKNLQNAGILSNITFKIADAEKLPFDDQSFDYYTIAFGLRNVTHIDKALEEARRVLKIGGRFFCLEFSHVSMPILRQFYDFYSFKILPFLGGLIANDEASYRYLAESIRKFPRADNLKARMIKAGFEEVSYQSLSGGIVKIHQGWRL